MVHAGTLSPFPTMGLWSFCGTSRQAQRRKDRGQGHKALGMEEHRQGKQQTVGHGHGHGQKPRPRPADHVDELDLVAGGHDDEVRDAPEVRKVEAAVVRGPAAGGPIPAAALRSPHRTLPIHPHASTHARTHTHRPTSHPTPNPPPKLRTSEPPPSTVAGGVSSRGGPRSSWPTRPARSRMRRTGNCCSATSCTTCGVPWGSVGEPRPSGTGERGEPQSGVGEGGGRDRGRGRGKNASPSGTLGGRGEMVSMSPPPIQD